MNKKSVELVLRLVFGVVMVIWEILTGKPRKDEPE
jgi:hypothetical protein